MGSSGILVGEVLWWTEGYMEDTKEWIDMVQHHLGWNLPILLHTGNDDNHGGRHPIFRQIL